MSRASEMFREVGDLRARTAFDRGSVSEDRVLEMQLGEFLDRLPMLLRIHVPPVVHGPQAGLVVDRISRDQERMSRVEERDAAARVARREDYFEAIELLPIVQHHVDWSA